jgi:hypothetical protein
MFPLQRGLSNAYGLRSNKSRLATSFEGVKAGSCGRVHSYMADVM